MELVTGSAGDCIAGKCWLIHSHTISALSSVDWSGSMRCNQAQSKFDQSSKRPLSKVCLEEKVSDMPWASCRTYTDMLLLPSVLLPLYISARTSVGNATQSTGVWLNTVF